VRGGEKKIGGQFHFGGARGLIPHGAGSKTGGGGPKKRGQTYSNQTPAWESGGKWWTAESEKVRARTNIKSDITGLNY